jgi:hypothetical protein
MSTSERPSLNSSRDKLVLISAAHGVAFADNRQITLGSTFLYDKENRLLSVLLEAFTEMAFIVHEFQKAHGELLAHGTPELDVYITQLNEIASTTSANYTIELHAVDLSTYFKAFLLLARAVLDKVVPLFSYMFNDNLNTFSHKGDRLINRIKHNVNVSKKAEFVSLIQRAKVEWLNDLVDLRDEYAHYSNLKEYTNFSVPGEWVGQRKFASILDFHRPVVDIAGKRVEALEYMLSIKAELVSFLRAFLQLCGFTPDRRPRHYLSCEECRYAFAQRGGRGDKKSRTLLKSDIEIQVKDSAKGYGVIICPKCGGKTDTDLEFWRGEGFSVERQP